MAEHLLSSDNQAFKADLERLFSPELAEVDEKFEGMIIPGLQLVTRQLLLSNMPEEAKDLAVGGFDRNQAYAMHISFFRRQYGQKWIFGKEHFVPKLPLGKYMNLSDRVVFAVEASTDNLTIAPLYSRSIDMTRPIIEYDERVAAVAKACLEASQQEADEK